MPGQPLVIENPFAATFNEALIRSANLAAQHYHSRTEAKKERDFEQRQRDWNNAWTSMKYIVDNAPEGSSWEDISTVMPGVNQMLDTVLGPGMSEQLQGFPVRKETIAGALEAAGLTALENNPAFASVLAEHSLVRTATGEQGGAVGLANAGTINDLTSRVLTGDPSAARTFVDLSRALRGEPQLRAVTLPDGTVLPDLTPDQAASVFQNGLNFQVRLAELAMQGQAQSGEAARLLWDHSKEMSDNLYEVYKVRVEPTRMMQLYVASQTPYVDPATGQDTGKTQLDVLYEANPEKFGAVWKYLADQAEGMEALFMLPMLGTPQGQGMLGSASAIQFMNNMGLTGESLLPMTQAFTEEYQKMFPDIPIGVVQSGVNRLRPDTRPGVAFPSTDRSPQRRSTTAPGSMEEPAPVPWEQMESLQKTRSLINLFQSGATDEQIAEAFRRAGKGDVTPWLKRARSQMEHEATTRARQPAPAINAPWNQEEVQSAPTLGENNPRALLDSLIQRFGMGPSTIGGGATAPAAGGSFLGGATARPQRIAGLTIADPHLAWIIQRESSGNPAADNPSSTAFGLGQLTVANRRAYARRFGFDPDTTNPSEQLRMMEAYIKDRYGSTERARQFWERNGWY